MYSSDNKTKFTLLSVGSYNLADTCRRLEGTCWQHRTPSQQHSPHSQHRTPSQQHSPHSASRPSDGVLHSVFIPTTGKTGTRCAAVWAAQQNEHFPWKYWTFWAEQIANCWDKYILNFVIPDRVAIVNAPRPPLLYRSAVLTAVMPT